MRIAKFYKKDTPEGKMHGKAVKVITIPHLREIAFRRDADLFKVIDGKKIKYYVYAGPTSKTGWKEVSEEEFDSYRKDKNVSGV